MVLKRTFMVYLLASLLMLKITDFHLIHYRCRFALLDQVKSTQGTNVDTAIYYWDFVRHLDRHDPVALENLVKYYLLAKDTAQAKDTLNKLLCMEGWHSPERPDFLNTYQVLTGRTSVNCQDLMDKLLRNN